MSELLGLGADKEKPKPKASPKNAKPPPTKPAPPKAAPKATPKPPVAKPPDAPLLTPEDWRAAAKFVSAKGADDVHPTMKAAPPREPPVMKAAPPKPGEPSNWYLLPDGTYFQDDRLPKNIKLKPGTKKLIGYVKGGPLVAGQSAYSVAGKAWNAPTTWYVMGGKVSAGNTLEARSISRGAIIFYKK